MKNKEFQKLLKKNRAKLNSGFTLTELLVGVVMSTFVIGALGFGLMQVLRTTQSEGSRTAARNETSRALDFISDEMRRAESIQVDKTAAIAGFTRLQTSGGADIDPSLILNVPGVTNPIVYTVSPPQTDTWKGPLVIYRWGPQLDGNGNYTSTFSSQALVDGVSDENQEASCGGSDVPYQGFFACVVDDDGDGTSGEAEDSDGKAITAQLYFTGGTTTADGSSSTYSANTKAVTRARNAPGNNSQALDSYSASLTSLTPQYGRESNGNPCWKVRSDFGSGRNPNFDPDAATPNANALQDIYTWIHEDNRQPQPLDIDTSKPFTMVASAFAAQNPSSTSFTRDCIARGNKFKQKLDSINDDGSNPSYSNIDASGNPVTAGNEVPVDGGEKLHTYENKLWHTIEFPQDGDTTTEIANKRATFNGNEAENADVKGDGTVYVFRSDSVVPDTGGYDVAGDNTFDESAGDQPSLREFLRDPNQDGNNSDAYVNSDGTFIDGKLGKDQRLIAFEIGQTQQSTVDNPNPGFDLQDNLFIISSDAFSSYDADDD